MLRAHSRHSVLLHSESNKHYFQLPETLAGPWSQHSSSTEREGMVTTLTGARTSELPSTEGENFTGFARIKPRTDPKPTPCMIPSAPRMQPMGLRINLTRTGYRQMGAAQWVALGQAEQWETANAGTGLQLPWWQRGSYLPFTLKVKTVGWERTEQRSGDILATAPTETPWSSSRPFTWDNMYFMHFYIYMNIHLQNMHISCIA